MRHVEYDAAVKDFLAQERVAVAGVSREGNAAANVVYRRLRAAGKKVYAVNPNADRVEDDPCYPDLAALPEPVDGVVIATAPAAGRDLVQQCVDRQIPRVWFHRSFGTGSTSEAAAALGKAKGLRVISGGCPLMHCEPVDLAHRCMRWVLDHTGGLPDSCR
ncbi:MAG: CoA-binding protein [bacterium]